MNPKRIDFETLDLNEKKKLLLDPKYWIYWINRIKYDTPFWTSFLIIFLIYWANLRIFIQGLDIYLQEGYITDIIVIISFLFLVYMCNVMPKQFVELIKILDKKEVFESNEYFSNYLDILHATYKSKKEKYLPLVFFIFSIIGINFYSFFIDNRFDLLGIISHIMASIIYPILVLLLVAAIIEFSYGNKFLKVLGTKKVKLKMNYQNLAGGIQNDIGSFIVKISLPSSILSMIFSILGLILIFFVNHPNGYIFIVLGLLITTYIIISFYRSTLNLHKAIVNGKRKLKEELLTKIEKISGEKPAQSHELGQKYQVICNIHKYIDRIDKIKNWPFNQTSIKNLIITLGTSVLPFLLSLFGLV